MNLVKVNYLAPAYEKAETVIKAPIKTVWNVLVDFTHWPEWNKSVTKMQLMGPVEPGTPFVWTAGGLKISSQIEYLESPILIVWSGKTLGIRAIHSWALELSGGETRVCTEESFEGIMVSLLQGQMKRTLASSLKQGLTALKEAAESRSSKEKQF